MPKTNSRVPAYCQHKASGQAVVRIDGRDIYLGVYNTSQSRKEYDRVVAEWLTRRRLDEGHSDGRRRQDLTIDEFLIRYLAWAKTYYVKNGRPTREFENLKHSIRPLVRLYGSTPIHELSPSRLKIVRLAMVEDGLARPTINARVNRIRRIIGWGVEEEYIRGELHYALKAVSPLKMGRSAAPETDPVKPVPDEHVVAILKVVPPMLSDMIRVHGLTGMRPGEVVLMRPCDVDRTAEVWLYRPQEHKTEHFGHLREVPLGPEAQKILAPYILTRRPEAYIFNPREAMSQRHAQRPTHRRKVNTHRKTTRKIKDRYTTQTYGRAVAYACKKAHVPHWFPNQLRHAAATRLRRTHGLDAAQAILGHKTAAITQVYAEVDRAKAMEVVKQVG